MIKFSVPEMSCGHCKASIESAIATVDADAKLKVDLIQREVTVESDVDTDALIAAMNSEGYEAQVIK